jgi:hypothetical protein
MRTDYDPSEDLRAIEGFAGDAMGYAAAAKAALKRGDEAQAVSHLRALVDVCDFAFSRSELVLRMLGYSREMGMPPRHPSA